MREQLHLEGEGSKMQSFMAKSPAEYHRLSAPDKQAYVDEGNKRLAEKYPRPESLTGGEKGKSIDPATGQIVDATWQQVTPRSPWMLVPERVPDSVSDNGMAASSQVRRPPAKRSAVAKKEDTSAYRELTADQEREIDRHDSQYRGPLKSPYEI